MYAIFNIFYNYMYTLSPKLKKWRGSSKFQRMLPYVFIFHEVDHESLCANSGGGY